MYLLLNLAFLRVLQLEVRKGSCLRIDVDRPTDRLVYPREYGLGIATSGFLFGIYSRAAQDSSQIVYVCSPCVSVPKPANSTAPNDAAHVIQYHGIQRFALDICSDDKQRSVQRQCPFEQGLYLRVGRNDSICQVYYRIRKFNFGAICKKVHRRGRTLVGDSGRLFDVVFFVVFYLYLDKFRLLRSVVHEFPEFRRVRAGLG